MSTLHILNTEPAYMDDAAFQERVRGSGRISYTAFRIAVAVLLAFALTCFVCRLCIRLVTRKRLFLDDGFLIVAATCLCASTGILFKMLFLSYIVPAMSRYPDLAYTTAFQSYVNQMHHNQVARKAFAFLNFTAIFAVKGCYLSFFNPFVKNQGRIFTYYWVVVVFTALAWVVSATEGFVYKKYEQIDPNTTDLNPTEFYNILFGYAIAIASVDILSDIMIISIPIFLLHKSTMPLRTRAGLILFLCLSVVMIACSIAMVSGFVTANADTTWRTFWQEVEACVAVMMASVTVFKSLLVSRQRREDVEKRPTAPYFIAKWHAEFTSSHGETDEESEVKTPTVPGEIFTGNGKFSRKYEGDELQTQYAKWEQEEVEAQCYVKQGDLRRT
ncbi:unnamed protein product [Periconia digitata]|uniref:Rhodopsin domain-containing protein n=1 Tax=Periconia digitata TaxID=1303443 RepID=A0A9W4XKD4_9PLEO|nr:unnamed protein product [Periconia digitata]